MNGGADRLTRVNRLLSESDGLYHRAARRLGLSDSAMRILYAIDERGDGCPLREVCRESGLSKQTINSALRKLEREGIVYLERDGGNAKRVYLTEAGKAYTLRTAARVREAERCVFSGWTQEEMEIYLRLMKRYNDQFRLQVEKLTKELP